MTPISPTVFVVDPDPATRDELAALFHRAGCRAETYASAGDFLGRPRRLVPSCLLLELDLPDRDGVELLGHVTAERVETPVIAISGRADIPTVVRAMRSGAMELLTKPLRQDVLTTAVEQAIVRSQLALQREVERQALRKRHATLSAREREVMTRVVAGLANKRIAMELGISEITVKAHRGRVMRKMAAESLPELVRMALCLAPEPAVAMRTAPSQAA